MLFLRPGVRRTSTQATTGRGAANPTRFYYAATLRGSPWFCAALEGKKVYVLFHFTQMNVLYVQKF